LLSVGAKVKNWGGNVRFSPSEVLTPTTTNDIVSIVHLAREQKKKIRVIGAGHSFSPLVATNQVLLDLKHMNQLISVDKDALTATFAAGASISKLTEELWQQGLALSNQGDINHQTLAGAVSTGTHGTGIKFGSISSFVTAIEFVDGNGEVHSISKNSPDDLLHAVQVQIGILGILTKITVQCEKRYILRDVRQIYLIEECLQRYHADAQQHRHVEFFWFPYSNMAQIKSLSMAEALNPRGQVSAFFDDEIMERFLYSGLCELTKVFRPMAKHTSRLCGSLMPTSDYSDWSYKVFPSSRKVRFTEMEYAVPFAAGLDCFRAIKKMIEDKQIRVFFPVEYRVAAADKAWISPFHDRPSAIISLHVFKGVEQEHFFSEAEAIFKSFKARPHWGKIHKMNAEEITNLYPKWSDFSKLRKKYDPDNLFLNDMLGSYFIG
jgi:FAD-linked oxidoreductase